jgi:hypothetical protein
MKLFKRESHAEAMRAEALKASLGTILAWINTVAGNGHFPYGIDIKKDFTSAGLSSDIVDTMKIELEKRGYKVTVNDSKLQIKW